MPEKDIKEDNASTNISATSTMDSSLQEDDEKKDEARGGRNLILLGVISTVIAVITSGVSIFIYHESGDIYLDRSRPGYLPEKTEPVDEDKQVYSFSEDGTIDENTLNEYLKNLKEEYQIIDDYDDPFSDKPLSDESLGLKKQQ